MTNTVRHILIYTGRQDVFRILVGLQQQLQKVSATSQQCSSPQHSLSLRSSSMQYVLCSNYYALPTTDHQTTTTTDYQSMSTADYQTISTAIRPHLLLTNHNYSYQTHLLLTTRPYIKLLHHIYRYQSTCTTDYYTTSALGHQTISTADHQNIYTANRLVSQHLHSYLLLPVHVQQTEVSKSLLLSGAESSVFQFTTEEYKE